MQPSKDSRPWVCCGANQGDALSVFAVNIHQLPVDAALASLRSAPSGLASAEAARRLDHFGPNQIERAIRTPRFVPFLRQFTHFFAVVLWIAALLALVAEISSPGQGAV